MKAAATPNFMATTAKLGASTAPAYAIESVDCALRVLRMLCEEKELRISEVAERLGVAPSTAHRLLSMLIHHGFARQDERRGGYRTGPRILEIGFAAIREMDVRQYARPILEEVRVKINETVHLGVPYGQHVFYVEGIESRHRLRVGLRVGEFVPANCVGLGKVMLATLSQSDFYRLFPSEELPRLTPNSINRRTVLERQLEEIRRLGYARSRAESDDGVGSVAVAVVDRQGVAHAAISVSAPLVRFSPEREAVWVETIQKAAARLRARLWNDLEEV